MQQNPFDRFDATPAQQPQPQPQQVQQAPQSIQIKPATKVNPIEQQRDIIGLERDRVALQKAQVDLQASQATDAKAAKTQESERTASYLAGNLAIAARQLQRLDGKGNPTLGTKAVELFGEVGNYATPEERQRAVNAQLAILEPALTLATGAAYNKEQLEGMRAQLFPALGDKPGTLADKAERLRGLLMTARVKAGSAAPQIDEVINALYPDPGRQPISTVGREGTAEIVKKQGEASFSTETDKEFTALAEAAFRNGATREQLDAISAKYGRPPFGPDLDQALQARDRGGIVMFNPPMSGQKDVSAEQAAVGEFMSTPAGAGLAGAGNGLLLGGLDEAGGALRSVVTGMPLEQAIAEADLQKQIIAQENPGSYALGNIGGGVASGLAATAGAARMGVTQGARVFSPGAMATDLAVGTTAGALESNQDRLGGAGLGAVAGLAGGVTGRTAGKAIAPTGGESLPLYEAGVRPTPGQRMGGFVNTTEEALGSIPLVGSAVRGARQKARDQFETGAFNKALDEIGLKLPKGVQNGADAHRFAQKRFSEAYDKAREGLSLVRDEKFVDDYKALAEEIAGGGLEEGSAKRFEAIVRNVVDRRMPNSRMDGAALKKVQSDLGKRAAAIRNSPKGDGELADKIEELSAILDDAARRSSTPEAVAALDAADRGYAQLVRIETASGMGAVEEAGRFTPKEYAKAVRKEAGGRATRSKAYLRGDALGQEYADAGLRLVDRVPNSGTPERQALTGTLMGGAGYLNPAIPAVPIAATVPYLPGVRNVTNALIAPRTGVIGDVANPLGNALSRASLAGPNALLLAGQN